MAQGTWQAPLPFGLLLLFVFAMALPSAPAVACPRAALGELLRDACIGDDMSTKDPTATRAAWSPTTASTRSAPVAASFSLHVLVRGRRLHPHRTAHTE